MLCATAPQYSIVPSGTYCVVSHSFLITVLGSHVHRSALNVPTGTSAQV